MSEETPEERPTRRRREPHVEASPPPQQQQPQQRQQQTRPIPDISVSQLVDEGTALLGYEAWTVRGALRGHDPDELMSIDAAKQEIEGWLKKPTRTASDRKEE